MTPLVFRKNSQLLSNTSMVKKLHVQTGSHGGIQPTKALVHVVDWDKSKQCRNQMSPGRHSGA